MRNWRLYGVRNDAVLSNREGDSGKLLLQFRRPFDSKEASVTININELEELLDKASINKCQRAVDCSWAVIARMEK